MACLLQREAGVVHAINKDLDRTDVMKERGDHDTHVEKLMRRKLE